MGSVREAWIALAHAVEPGDARLGARVNREGPEVVVDMISQRDQSIPEGVSARWDAAQLDACEQRAASVGARIVTRADTEWPHQLDDLGPRAPFALWVAGAPDLRLTLVRSVAIVGARASTRYGDEIARRWAAELAGRPITVVSGGAFGIDAAAHRGALLAGLTVCVVAGGVDVTYPQAHASLLSRIADEGLIVSETPPGQSVRRQRFLSRNRLIAALTQATVVVEAADHSGTASTAREANSINRPVAAVPGPVDSASSRGCHRLIRDHEAILVCTSHDVEELIPGGLGEDASIGGTSEQGNLGARERQVLDSLPMRGSMEMDALVCASGLRGGEVAAAIGLLELRGLIESHDSGWRLRR
jgi:DNA processing protein